MEKVGYRKVYALALHSQKPDKVTNALHGSAFWGLQLGFRRSPAIELGPGAIHTNQVMKPT